MAMKNYKYIHYQRNKYVNKKIRIFNNKTTNHTEKKK